MSDDLVILKVEDGVATITLNRPQVGNAVDLPMARSLRDAVIQCADDGGVRCVVLTGAGRMFCVGGDVAAMAAAGEARPEFLHELVGAFHEISRPLMQMDKPVLALVNGPAAGAGLALALSADVVLAARSASFLAAYAAVGLTADGGLSWLLPRLVGMRKAQAMILLNQQVSAEEAERIGLVSQVVDDGELLTQGRQMANTLAASSMPAFAGSRRLLRASFEASFEQQLELEHTSMTSAARTPESAEGIAAFLARRKPDFRPDIA